MDAILGPRGRAAIEELRKYVVTEPRPFVLDLEKSEGMWLATVDGGRIFDWAGWYGSKLVGHNHPRLYAPDYVRRLVRAANNKCANPDFLTEECVAYYRALHGLAPRCMQGPGLEVYAVNSGAEAVENLMKYFLNLHHEKMVRKGRAPSARRFVYFDQAFHGRTVFALNVTRMSHDPMVTKDFQGLVPGNVQVPFPALDTDAPAEETRRKTEQSLAILDAVLGQYGDEIVGIVVEPLQGAGGHRCAEPEFFRRLSALAHAHDVFLGFDEVQTAGGPTGTFFAVDAFDLPHPPQAVASGKKLANGVVYMRQSMRDHGVLDSTWGGTLADMVRFVEELAIVREERLIEQVPDKSAHLVAALRQVVARHGDLAHNVRGLGLYQGFSLRDPADKGRLLAHALDGEALLMLGAGDDTIRLRPHLHVSLADVDELAVRLDRAFVALRAEKSRDGARAR